MGDYGESLLSGLERRGNQVAFRALVYWNSGKGNGVSSAYGDRGRGLQPLAQLEVKRHTLGSRRSDSGLMRW